MSPMPPSLSFKWGKRKDKVISSSIEERVVPISLNDKEIKRLTFEVDENEDVFLNK